MPFTSALVFPIRTAATADGQYLPVIDVTHPAFALDDSPQGLEAMREGMIADVQRRRLPYLLLRCQLWLASRRSLLLRAVLEPDAAYLGGLSTYVMKLGPDNLAPPFDSAIDRKIAASPAVTAMRLRLQQLARLTAEGLQQELASQPSAPLHLLNIGGGPAIDTLNALILLRQSAPDALARPVTIHVLDVDWRGPGFGAHALAALGSGGGPLAGLDIAFQHELYDWNDTAPLARLVDRLADQGAVMAAMSEGALFEYAGDDVVLANLAVLRAGGRGVRLMTGSVTRADELTCRMLAQSRFKLQPRGIDGFAPLAARAGFAIADVATAPMSDQVLLRPQ